MQSNYQKAPEPRLYRPMEESVEAGDAASALLREADEVRSRLAAIVQSSDDAIISKDLNGVIMTWNRGAQRLFGYTEDEVIGRPVTILIPAERLDEEPGVLARIRRGESVEHYETVRRRKDGSLIDISLSVSPIVDSSGRVIGASKIARDISQRKRAEKALQEADQRKDEFLATLAHELRNPLAPLTTSLEILRLNGFEGPMPRSVVEVMERQVHHLARLVDDLLEVSRISRGKIELKRAVVPVAAVIKAALEIAQPAIDAAGHRLELDLPPESVVVTGDQTRLTQVIANLLNNAAKFTPRGGRIGVGAEAHDREVAIRVTDNGIGIPRDMLGSVFEMFAQVRSAQDRAAGGLGIGLALVQRLVHLHGGTVEARSAGSNLGSEFIVRLPLAGAPPMEARGAFSPLAPPITVTTTPRRMLVVDDNRDAADSLVRLLRAHGHHVDKAHGGREALQMAEQLRPEVVLLDLGMPGMSGYEVASRLRAQSWGQKMLLVAVTGWGLKGDRKRTAEYGFNHHLVKPVAYAALEKLLPEPQQLVSGA